MLKFIKILFTFYEKDKIKKTCKHLIDRIIVLQEILQYPINKKDSIISELNIIKEKLETIVTSIERS